MRQAQVNKPETSWHGSIGRSGLYERYIKRLLDIICSLAAIVVFGWFYMIVAVLVRVKLGSPVLFKQLRPGKIDPKAGEEERRCHDARLDWHRSMGATLHVGTSVCSTGSA